MTYKIDDIFTSKADVLQFLQSKIKKSSIELLFYFTIEEWNDNQDLILKKIEKIFNSSKKIIIRSSAVGEDSIENSLAGTYNSILDVSPDSRQEIKNGIEFVKKSYEDNNNLNPNIFRPSLNNSAFALNLLYLFNPPSTKYSLIPSSFY